MPLNKIQNLPFPPPKANCQHQDLEAWIMKIIIVFLYKPLQMVNVAYVIWSIYLIRPSRLCGNNQEKKGRLKCPLIVADAPS